MTTDEKLVKPEATGRRSMGVTSGSAGSPVNPVKRVVDPSSIRSRTQINNQARRAFPSPFNSSAAPPSPAIKHVLQWTLSTESGGMPERLDALAQSVLSKIASAPNEWFDLSKTIIKFDLLPDVLSRVVDGSTNQQFANFGLAFERDGNKVRFTQS